MLNVSERVRIRCRRRSIQTVDADFPVAEKSQQRCRREMFPKDSRFDVRSPMNVNTSGDTGDHKSNAFPLLANSGCMVIFQLFLKFADVLLCPSGKLLLLTSSYL